MSLQGIRVGVPASRRAAETARLIQRHGGEAVVGPVMVEVPEDAEVLRPVTEEILGAGLTHSVHLTGVGTRMWFEAAEAVGLLDDLLGLLRAITVVARGPKSAKALREWDLEPAWMPTGERSSEIAERLSTELSQGDVVAVQLYGRPVPHLSDALARARARVIEVAPYRWGLPEDTSGAEDLVREIVAGRVQAMVVTSAPQVDLLLEVAGRLGSSEALREALRERVFCAAVGEVAAEGLTSSGAEPDLVAEPARMGALVRELAAARDGILAKAGEQ